MLYFGDLYLCLSFNCLQNDFHLIKDESTEKTAESVKGDFNDQIIGNGTNVSKIGNDILEHQTNGLFGDSEKIFDDASQSQVIGINSDNEIRKMTDNAALVVENGMQDATLTAMDKIVIPRVEMPVRSVACSSGHGRNSVFKNPDWRDFTGAIVKTPLVSFCSRLDLNIDQDRID